MGTKQLSIIHNLLPKIIAALFVLVGIYTFFADLQVSWKMLTGENDFSLFIVFFVIASIIFAIYLIRLGIEIWSVIDANIVRQISIISTVFLWVYAHSFIDDSLTVDGRFGIIHAISMAIAAILYLVVYRLFLKLFKVETAPISSGLMTFFKIYLNLLALSFILLPVSFFKIMLETEIIDSKFEPLLSLVIFPISIIAAIIFYKWCKRKMEYSDLETEYIDPASKVSG